MEELGQFDLAALDEMDPSLEGGFKVQFDRELPIELRLLSNIPKAFHLGSRKLLSKPKMSAPSKASGPKS
jgi:hypothetical protein